MGSGDTLLHNASATGQSTTVKLFAQHVPSAAAGHNYMYVYSDIISPVQFGSQTVNILDAIALPGDVSSKGANLVMYKSVA